MNDARANFPDDLPISFNLGATLDIERDEVWQRQSQTQTVEERMGLWIDFFGRHAMRTAIAVRDLEREVITLRARLDERS